MNTPHLNAAQYIERVSANTADALQDLILQLTGERENVAPDSEDLIALSETDAKQFARLLMPLLTNVQRIQSSALFMTGGSDPTRVELNHAQRIYRSQS